MGTICRLFGVAVLLTTGIAWFIPEERVPDQARMAELVPFDNGSGSVVLRDEDGEGVNQAFPPRTRCEVVSEVTGTTVVVLVDGRRYWAYRGCVKPVGFKGANPQPRYW